jgi:type IV pilus assembly protein PilY1
LYIGDLLGNLWKFDLTSGTPADWGSSFGTAGAPIPFFVAVDGNGVAQPITGMPGLGINARKGDANFGKRYVFFGTGRYITSSDVTNTQTMSWYGLIDNGAAITNGRTDLKQRSIEIEGPYRRQGCTCLLAGHGRRHGRQEGLVHRPGIAHQRRLGRTHDR